MKDEYMEFTTPRPRLYKRVYQLHISLSRTQPLVWRRVQVPESYTFYDLHVAIQDAMGWQDYHLFEFTKGESGSRPDYRIVSVFDEPENMPSDIKYAYATEVPIKKLLKKERDSVLYIYDFGDGWEHIVTLEKILPRDEDIVYPVCIDGVLACPPEDCGSIPGYYDCIKAVKNRKNKELLRWLGDWRPETFDTKAVKFEPPWKRLKKALKG
ncbi:MAG: plasmid pRiA4b ORF-3 family protein [Candidatus Omnitrophica bacterium]|nr:plasmid pRiA4b ORF-3 family protein [Candidatus Omnitrophota bacterium]